MTYQNIFQRYELKYLVTQEQRNLLLEAMEPYMEPDEYGRSTIRNIYYDTPDFLLARRSLEKPVYKEKLRLRSYGAVRDEGRVFLELKKKYKGVVYKRRVSATRKEAMDYLLRGRALPEQNQITGELDYFRKMYKDLGPAVFLSYDRRAYRGREDGNLRVTFDENILWRQENLSLGGKPCGTPILEPRHVLMEIKIADAMPLWLCRLLSENGIFKTSFSKYGNAYLQIEKQNVENQSGGQIIRKEDYKYA